MFGQLYGAYALQLQGLTMQCARRVPELLQQFMPKGINFIPFRKTLNALGKLIPK